MRDIVIVQHEPSVPPGLIGLVAAEAGAAVTVFEAWRDDMWPAAGEIAGLVVLGGTMNVDEIAKHPFLGRSRALMGDAMKQGVPTLGVCLGAQMMARVLGAPVRRAGERNAVFSTLELTEEGSNDPLTAPFDGLEVLQFHEDTFEIPDGAVPLATSVHSSLAQAFRYGDNAYAIQFHFEVDRPILKGWIEDIGHHEMLEGWGRDPSDLLGHADRVLDRQALAGARLMEGFLALGR